MSFLDQLFSSLERSGDAVVLRETRADQTLSVTARELLAQVQVGRAYQGVPRHRSEALCTRRRDSRLRHCDRSRPRLR